MAGVVVEVCVEDIASAVAAALGGADRVELCSNRGIGGITPGLGSVAVASEELAIPLHVLIRPRGGDFHYSRAEFAAMRVDIEAVKPWASGVVLGVLTGDRRVDRARTAELVATARPMAVTFHKAFDDVDDPIRALDDLIELGLDRVLTSGGAGSAIEGLDTLVDLTRRADGRIAVMAGGSIRVGEVPTLVAAGLLEIHVGSAAFLDGKTDADATRAVVESARSSPVEILHVTTQLAWDRAVSEGAYRAESLATEGFIHASTAEQVASSLDRFFRGRSGLVVLRIDPRRVRAPIRWERSPHSALPFPHLYGPLDPGAVTGVVPLGPDGSGRSRWPPP